LLRGLEIVSERFLPVDKRPGGKRTRVQKELAKKLSRSFINAYAERYGSPRVTRVLRQEGLRVGEN
jgi:hypothetical protein